MRNGLIIFCCMFCCSVSACSDDQADDSYVTPPDEAGSGSPEDQRALEEFLREGRKPLSLPETDDDAPGGRPRFSGEWEKRDGEWVCDGYLTRDEDEVHCSAHVPDDWIPFEFEGRTYYVAPLNVDN